MKKQFLLRFFTGTPLIAWLAFAAASPTAAAETLVPRGSVWKYLDNGSDQGTAWREPAFNDSTWASGPAQLGYGDGDEVTIVRFGTNAANKYITTYFRMSFDAASANYSNVTVNLLRDDGAVVYLHGVEVFRSNMPDGPVSFSTLAVLAVGGAEETTQFITAAISPSVLVSGRNVLAVEVHQNAAPSSDLSFDLELVADGAGAQLPVVAVQTVDGQAAEVPPNSDQPTNPAVFRITRAGPTDGALSIVYTLGGSASNGVDYVTLPGAIEIPAGAVSVDIQVDVIDDTLVEGLETVVLTLVSPACVAMAPPPPGCYRIGLPNSASAVILDSSVVSNSPPTVALTSPRDGAVIWGPTNIWLMAMANDADGYLTLKSVEFFEGARSLGIRTNYPTLTPGNPFILQWSNVPLGNYTLTAVATDDHAARATSAPVHISVITAPAEVTFVSTGAAWRYMDRGINLSNAWTGVLFNDGDWPAGPAQLGYGDGDEATVVGFGPDPANKYVTTYFRKKFEVFDAAGYAQLRGRLREDDGAVVYVNGVEVFRSNLPPAPATFNTLATSAVEDQILEFTAPPSALREGLNVVAVEMHQVNPASSDLSFDLELIGERGSRPSELPVINVVATVTNTVENSPLALVAPGVFTLTRTGPTTNALAVFISLSGSAQNGVDYVRITNEVRFASGQSEARVNVNALPDNLVEGTETVVLTLESPTCVLVMPPPPGCYRPGTSSQATVFIKDGPGGNQPPFVQLNAPQNGEVFTAPAPIDLRAYAQDDEDGTQLKVEFFAGDQNLGQGIFVPALCPSPFCPFYALTWSNVPPGSYTLRAKATDSAGASSFSQPVGIRVVSTSSGTNVIIAMGSVWKYLDDGSDQATAWRQRGFDDSAWASGPAQLGYGDGDESTVVGFGPDPANKYITTYFRRTFAVTNSALARSPLHGRLLQDDGAVVYLNGVEVFRSNLPTGPITFDTLAVAVSPDNQIVEFSVPAGYLSNGVNVVAVEMHQVNPVSSDLSFDLELTTSSAIPNQPPQVRITRPLNGAVFDSPTNIILQAVTTDPDGYASTVEFFADDAKIGEASIVFIQPPPPGQELHFEFAWPNPALGQHRLTARTVDNAGAPAVSSPVNITVKIGEPGIGPARRNQQQPAVAANGEIYLVVWADQRDFNDNEWDVYAARVTPAGKVLDPNGIRICALAGIQYYPAVASDGHDFLVVWTDGRNQYNASEFDTYGARVTAEGVVLQTNGFPISTAKSSQFIPSLAFNGTEYLVTWYDYRNFDNPQLGNDIYAARVTREGVVLDPLGIGICTAENMQWAPGVAAVGSDFFVAWDDSRYSIRGTRVSSDGLVSNSNGLVLSPNFSGYPIRVGANGAGYLVVWTDSRNYSTTRYDIFAHRVNGAGEITGSDLVLSHAAEDQAGPALAPAGEQYLSVWLDSRQGSNTMIFGTRIGPDGAMDPNGIAIGRAASSSAWNAPGVASLNDAYLIAWVGGRDDGYGETDIIAARLTTGGTLLDTNPFLVSTATVLSPDTDGDGVPDARDRCPGTSSGAIVNAEGCSLAQLCPCDAPWGSHAEYVACVIRHTWDFFRQGLITAEQRRELVRNAVIAICGHDPLRTEPVCVHLLPLTPGECRLGGMRFVLSGDVTGNCVLECSTDLIHWTPVISDPVSIDGAEIACPMDNSVPARFYRVRSE
jgi:hypothetical protein